ncbi:HNH endonuclease signature motif containing protein [Brevibacterium atlanticum]|uniref:HNH endonuclease signature motif containing protein n=1 Tax=Brevibacterium atlanticum TaxID=2697563 RepID=UPI001D1836D6|nr:HNH endonuclease signature motif containing protein [Brevibacterium atlanticum]
MTLTPEDKAEDAPDRGAPKAPQSSGHPLLADEEWADLTRFAPEVTEAITHLMDLKDGLRTFDRAMGPDQAIMLVDGVEALNRINDALSTLALAVCERVGTPSEYGAKSTKALIENRLNLSGAEAHRRTEMAKNLGGRVDFTGQALPPVYPLVADALHAGTISAGQATVIESCMKKVPAWADETVRTDIEKRLVTNAPKVRLKDLREIFDRLMGHIDPDGSEPVDPTDRSKYCVNLKARNNGDWELSGLLDPVAGGTLNGLLTSRIQSAKEAAEATTTLSDEATTPAESDDELLDIVDAVLSGERHDAVKVPTPELRGASGERPAADTPGIGVRTDGRVIDMSGEQPSVREWIYERFAGLVSTIDKQRTAAGAPYALVITAKAEDVATGQGTATTGSENPVPISELAANGLNGSVFFHLMSDTAKTVQVATEQRFANRKQIAVITARDRGCTFPGCDAPPGWCDVNHVVPYSAGGETDINNLMLACSYHHHLLDRSEWETHMLLDGRPSWVPPSTVDPARTPILHSRFIADDIIDTLFDD